VYVLEGEGVVLEGNAEHKFHAGDSIFVASDEVHQFRNTGRGPLRFLCMIPRLDKCGM
jgi:quercetin dioxygenase-like cupin family protein